MATESLLVFLRLTIILGVYFISIIDGFSVKMISVNSPHLKILPKTFTHRERHQFLANISMSRALNHRKKLQGMSPNSIKQTMYKFKSSYFVTQLNFGGGPGSYSPYMIVDTGSDVTWVQCEDCNPCFSLKGPSFPYKKSTSFVQLGVHDSTCLPPVFYYQGACGLSLGYGLGSTAITGIFGKDNFRFLNATTGQLDNYPGLIFGCATKNENFHFGENDGPENQIAGVFGLAAATPYSLVNQLTDQIQGRFSYCIPEFNPVNGTSSTINFGIDAQIRGDAMTQVKTIAMHSGDEYFLYLTGISVDRQRVMIDSSFFGPDDDFKKGLFIDSGSPFTVLAESIYNPVKDHIVKYFKDKYHWVPNAPQGTWDLCYELSYFHEWEVPEIMLHFWNIDRTEEVDMLLDKYHLFQDLSEEYDMEGFCFMVVPQKDPGPCYLGAFQQTNFKFLYDINNGALSFVPQKCDEKSS